MLHFLSHSIFLIFLCVCSYLLAKWQYGYGECIYKIHMSVQIIIFVKLVESLYNQDYTDTENTLEILASEEKLAVSFAYPKSFWYVFFLFLIADATFHSCTPWHWSGQDLQVYLLMVFSMSMLYKPGKHKLEIPANVVTRKSFPLKKVAQKQIFFSWFVSLTCC